MTCRCWYCKTMFPYTKLRDAHEKLCEKLDYYRGIMYKIEDKGDIKYLYISKDAKVSISPKKSYSEKTQISGGFIMSGEKIKFGENLIGLNEFMELIEGHNEGYAWECDEIDREDAMERLDKLL